MSTLLKLSFWLILLSTPLAAAFSYQRTLTIDHTKCGSSNSTNFPVLVSLTDTTLKTIANGGHVTSASGYDIVFYSDAALTTKLNHEIERYISTTGEIIMWVNIGTVSSSVDTLFYMGYGDGSLTTSQESITATWNSNYKGVWHLPNGTTLTYLDSTASAFNGTASSTPPTAGTGQIGGAGVFVSASTEYVTMGNVLDTDGLGARTMSIWFKRASTGAAHAIMTKQASGTNGGYVIRTQTDDTILCSYVGTTANGLAYPITTSTFTSTSLWYHLVCTYDGSRTVAGIKIYINGSLAGVTTGADTLTTSSTSTIDFNIGSRNSGTQPFNGSLDEARVSAVAHSADWITTEYNNQSSPSTFITLGAEGPGPRRGGLPLMGIGD